jgi:predicted  nucleic acid-binding Zn-ribbon protein
VTASSLSSESGRGGRDSASEADRIDLVRTLRDLNSLELDCTKRPPELERLRLSLRTKVPWDILMIHDALVTAGKRSSAPRFANACTECSGEVVVKGGEKRIAGTFVQCPHCGTLLYG